MVQTENTYLHGAGSDALGLGIVADAFGALAFFILAGFLVFFGIRRADLTWRSKLGVHLFAALAALTCAEHLLGFLGHWIPLQPFIHGMTLLAAIAVTLAIVVVLPLVPSLLSIPSPMDFRRKEKALEAEIERRRAAEDELQHQARGLADAVDRQTRRLMAANRDLEIARAKAEAASAAKSQFLASMSHEIRTPMNGVLGMTDALLMSDHDADTRSGLQSIKESGKVLLEIINDILDLSKIEAGIVSMLPRVVMVRDVVSPLMDLWRPAFETKGLAFTCTMSPRCEDASIRVDDTRLCQILQNLISNAYKYTKSGSVTVEIDMEDTCRTSDMPCLCIKVSDTGSGIPADKQDIIFQEFERLETDTAIPGTGLGLAIVKRLVELMDGTLTIDSAPGRGSVFSVAIPTHDGRVATPLAPQSGATSPVTAGKQPPIRILAIDDNAANCDVLRHILRSLGQSPAIVDCGEDALDLVDAEPFDLLLIDVRMPGMSGVDLLAALHDRFGAQLPFRTVALTADAMEGARERYREAGFDDYLPKPLSPQDLARIVRDTATVSAHRVSA